MSKHLKVGRNKSVQDSQFSVAGASEEKQSYL